MHCGCMGGPRYSTPTRCSQFTSPRFTRILLDATVKVSMDGRGRWMDNVMIERLWRSLKYECVYLHAFETGSAARDGIGRWIDFYNTERPHSALGGRTPVEVIRALTFRRQHDQQASLAAPQSCPGNGDHLTLRKSMGPEPSSYRLTRLR